MAGNLVVGGVSDVDLVGVMRVGPDAAVVVGHGAVGVGPDAGGQIVVDGGQKAGDVGNVIYRVHDADLYLTRAYV